MAEYIDREAAICEIKQITAIHYGSMWDYAVHCYAGACLRDCKEAICGIPAADVAPVMHGKWIHTKAILMPGCVADAVEV